MIFILFYFSFFFFKFAVMENLVEFYTIIQKLVTFYHIKKTMQKGFLVSTNETYP